MSVIDGQIRTDAVILTGKLKAQPHGEKCILPK